MPDHNIVMTLDAGGTNFVFSAISDGREIVAPVHLPSNADNLDSCLDSIILGFEKVGDQLPEVPKAISFAFPGPSDYTNGVIGDLGNLPAFRGGIALGPMLQERFGIPVYINNDGDLFAYGEAMFGMLPAINHMLKHAGSSKKFDSLFGITLGTGFGGGLVTNSSLYVGDNNAGNEVWLLRSPFIKEGFIEENISARAIINSYSKNSGNAVKGLTPYDVYRVARRESEGNHQAAVDAFETFGIALGKALKDIITVFDCPVVIGGGLANASKLFFPAMFNELNSPYSDAEGNMNVRLAQKVVNFEDRHSIDKAIATSSKMVKVPRFEKYVPYNEEKWVGIGISKLGTSKAISLGAYAFALNAIKEIVSQ